MDAADRRSAAGRSADGGGKRCLVTGGAGFLGSHLCASLIDRGHEVYCLDDMSTGREANVAPLKASGRLNVVAQRVEDDLPADLPRLDEIYNLACPASPVHYQADPVRTALTSALGARNMLLRAERDGARVLHASTSEVYGDPDIHPQTESYNGNVNAVGPRACYDEGKRFAETLFTDFARTRGVSVRIARIFNTYGPRMHPDDGRVVSNFIVQALRGEDLTVYGEGSQTRSFCYVDDLIAGFDALMHADGPIDGPVNLGNPVEITVAELARTILAMTGSRARLVRKPLPVDDPRRRCPDIGKARRALGWEPRVGLEQGLRATIAYFEAELGAGRAAAPSAAAPHLSRSAS
jgi:UDP-glucuronate decarboxylase